MKYFQKGTWRWNFGFELTYSNWDAEKPANAGGNGNCLSMPAINIKIARGWSDTPCNQHHWPLCMKV